MDTSKATLAIAKEVSWGVVPSVPFKELRFTRENLAQRTTTVQSQELNSLAQTREYIRTAIESGGPVSVEMSFETFDEILEGVARADWTRMPVKYGATEITGISGTNTVGVDAGGTNFKAGHLIKLSGWPTAGNNAVKKVTSSTGTTVVTTGLSNESSVSTSRMKVIGFQGASGDLAAVISGGNGLTSSALDFTTLGLPAAPFWIKIGNDDVTAEKLATAACNGMVRVSSVTANKIYFDRVPSGWTADAGTSKTLSCYVPDIIKNGIAEKSFVAEAKVGTGLYKLVTGARIGAWNLNIAADQIIGGDFSFLGKVMTKGTSSASTGSYVAAPTGNVMNSVDHVDSVFLGSLPADIDIMTLNLAHNLNPRSLRAIASRPAVGIGLGTMEVRGSIESYTEDGNQLDEYLAFNPTSLAYRLKDASKQGYMVDLLRVKRLDGGIENPGQNNDFMDRYDIGLEQDPTYGCLFVMNRFELF